MGRDSLSLKVDVTQPDAVRSMIGAVVNQFGRLDIGVNDEGAVRSARWAEAIPLKRLERVDDLVGIVVYLASPASDNMTDQNLIIDGGASLGTYEPQSFPFF